MCMEVLWSDLAPLTTVLQFCSQHWYKGVLCSILVILGCPCVSDALDRSIATFRSLGADTCLLNNLGNRVAQRIRKSEEYPAGTVALEVHSHSVNNSNTKIGSLSNSRRSCVQLMVYGVSILLLHVQRCRAKYMLFPQVTALSSGSVLLQVGGQSSKAICLHTAHWNLTTLLEKREGILKGLGDARMCLHFFVNSEAYHEQLGPLARSNGSLDRTLSNSHTYSHGDVLIRPSIQQSWARDRKII